MFLRLQDWLSPNTYQGARLKKTDPGLRAAYPENLVISRQPWLEGSHTPLGPLGP